MVLHILPLPFPHPIVLHRFLWLVINCVIRSLWLAVLSLTFGPRCLQAFFNPEYLKKNPDDKEVVDRLKRAIGNQVRYLCGNDVPILNSRLDWPPTFLKKYISH